MNENYIIIENIKENDIEEVLMDLANRYNNEDNVTEIQLYRKKGKTNSFLILFTNPPDFEKFCYFVNYIRYPEVLKNIKPFLRAFYKISDIQENHSFKKGNFLMIFVDENDSKYDNVTLVNDCNENYIYSFGESHIKNINATYSFKQIEVDIENYNHIIDIIPEIKEENTKNKWWKFW